MLNLNSVMIGTKQPLVLAAFYEKVLGKPADMVDQENGFWGWQVGSAFMSLLQHSEMGGNTKDPGRVMINFETPQVKEEFERIKALGAQSSESVSNGRGLDCHAGRSRRKLLSTLEPNGTVIPVEEFHVRLRADGMIEGSRHASKSALKSLACLLSA